MASEFHKEHQQLESDIIFYKLEISFLLKLIKPEYSKSPSAEKIKTLDSYWKEFEQYYLKLERLAAEIKQQEHVLTLKYKENFKKIFVSPLKESSLMTEYFSVRNSLKSIKASLYEYLMDLNSMHTKSLNVQEG